MLNAHFHFVPERVVYVAAILADTALDADYGVQLSLTYTERVCIQPF